MPVPFIETDLAMPAPSRSAADWDALIDQYLAVAPATSQRLFCEQHGISFDAFRNQYQKSAKFAGKRRGPKRPATQGTGAFAPVTTRAATASTMPTSATSARSVTMRLGALTIECPVGLGIDTIAELARQTAREALR